MTGRSPAFAAGGVRGEGGRTQATRVCSCLPACVGPVPTAALRQSLINGTRRAVDAKRARRTARTALSGSNRTAPSPPVDRVRVCVFVCARVSVCAQSGCVRSSACVCVRASPGEQRAAATRPRKDCMLLRRSRGPCPLPRVCLSVPLSVTCVGCSHRACPSLWGCHPSPAHLSLPRPDCTTGTVGCPSFTNLTRLVLIQTTVCLRPIAGRSHDALQARLVIRTRICTSTRGLSGLVALLTELSARGNLIGHVFFVALHAKACPSVLCGALFRHGAPPHRTPHTLTAASSLCIRPGVASRRCPMRGVACFGDACVGAHAGAVPGRCRRAAHVRTSGGACGVSSATNHNTTAVLSLQSRRRPRLLRVARQ